MKNYYLLILLLVFIGCNKAKNNSEASDNVLLDTENNAILAIDVTKEYPKSEQIFIQDIAEVEYILLETTKDFLCEGGGDRALAFMNDSLIIYLNGKTADILIFSRAGKALKKINRKGQSGEEYASLNGVVFDAKSRELYLNDMLKQRIFVYDINGNFKRSFPHLRGAQYSRFYNLNEHTLLCYNGRLDEFDNEKYPFKIISKQDGTKIKDIEIPFEKRIDTRYNFIDEKGGMMIFYAHSIHPAVKIYEKTFVLNEVSSDTIYKLSSEDFSLTPFIVQNPSVQSMGENPQYISFLMATSNYIFMIKQKKEFDKTTQTGFPTTFLTFDINKKELFEQNFYNRDVSGRSTYFSYSINNNQNLFVWFPHVLKNRLNQGVLSGKLKEIAEKIDEEDNPVLMVITFKE